MKHRDEYIKELNSLIKIDEAGIDMGSLRSWFLTPFYFADIVQIVECFDKDGDEKEIGRHLHEDSYELFYQLEGETTFYDGTILQPHQTKLVTPGERHSLTPKKGSKFIVIIHPPEIAYKKLSKG